jgi:hypothetical protein
MKPSALAALSALLFVGCVHVPIGGAAENDEVCGVTGTVEVRLRAFLDRSMIDCPEALRKVAIFSPTLREHWTVIYTGGFPGMSVDRNMNARFPAGVTYPATRTIVLRPWNDEALRHEMGHAYDIENGLPNTRDGVDP